MTNYTPAIENPKKGLYTVNCCKSQCVKQNHDSGVEASCLRKFEVDSSIFCQLSNEMQTKGRYSTNN